MLEAIKIDKDLSRPTQYYMTTEDCIIAEMNEANRKLKAEIRRRKRLKNQISYDSNL